MALSEEDVQKIVEALIPVIDARLQESLQAQDPVNGETEPDGDELPTDDMGDMGEPEMLPPENELPADDARPSIEGDESEDQPVQMEEDGEPAQYQMEDDDDESSDPDDEPIKPAVAKYAKMRDERDAYVQKYRKAVADKRELQQKYEKLAGQVTQYQRVARDADRRQTFVEFQSQGYVLDVDDEMEYTKDFNAVQFTKHCDRVPVTYQKVPLGGNTLPMTKPRTSSTGQEPDEKQVARYSKEARDFTAKYMKENPKADSHKIFKEAYNRAATIDQGSAASPPSPGV